MPPFVCTGNKIMRFLLTAFWVNLKLSLSMRLSFVITIFIVAVKHSFFLISWKYFFARYNILQGWNYSEMLLMYGIVSLSIGFVEVFFYGLREMPKMIETSQIDIFLLQPKNMLLNVAISKGDITALGEMVLGFLLMGFSGYLRYPTMLIIVALAILFIFSLYLYLSCLAFFMKNTTSFIRELYQSANLLMTQPSSSYHRLFKIFAVTLLPTAFVSFFPVEYMRTNLIKYLLFTSIGTFTFFSLASWLFKLGLKRYESSNIIAPRI